MAPFIAACLWVVLAWVLSVVLTARQSWPAAYGLIAVGVPIALWLGWTFGIGAGVLAVLVGCLVLRWPVIYAGRWIKRKWHKE